MTKKTHKLFFPFPPIGAHWSTHVNNWSTCQHLFPERRVSGRRVNLDIGWHWMVFGTRRVETCLGAPVLWQACLVASPSCGFSETHLPETFPEHGHGIGIN